MKTLTAILLLSLLPTCVVKGQTVGDRLALVRNESVGGQLEVYRDGFTFEFYDKDTDLTWLYFFGLDSVCTSIAIHPETHRAKTQFIAFLDGNTIRANHENWFIERGDGVVLNVGLKDTDGTGTIFVISSLE